MEVTHKVWIFYVNLHLQDQFFWTSLAFDSLLTDTFKAFRLEMILMEKLANTVTLLCLVTVTAVKIGKYEGFMIGIRF